MTELDKGSGFPLNSMRASVSGIIFCVCFLMVQHSDQYDMYWNKDSFKY